MKKGLKICYDGPISPSYMATRFQPSKTLSKFNRFSCRDKDIDVDIDKDRISNLYRSDFQKLSQSLLWNSRQVKLILKYSFEL